MTFVGKILVVVQLVLSFCLMAFAGAVFTTRENWKAERDRLAKQVADQRTQYEAQITLLESDRDRLTKQVRDAENERDTALGELRNVTRQRDALDQQLKTARNELALNRELAAISDEQANYRRAEALEQRALNGKLNADRDRLVQAVRNLEDIRFTYESEREIMLAKHESILNRLAVAERILRENDIDPKRYVALQSPPPQVEGEVTATRKGKRNNTEYVEITIGGDDGLVEGHVLEAYRTGLENGEQPRYLGRIRIVYVAPDRAVGLVIEKAKNGVIREGDHVSTKL